MELDGPFLKSWPFRRTFARETRVRRFLCARETVKERPESAGRGDNLCRGPELVKNARSNWRLGSQSAIRCADVLVWLEPRNSCSTRSFHRRTCRGGGGGLAIHKHSVLIRVSPKWKCNCGIGWTRTRSFLEITGRNEGINNKKRAAGGDPMDRPGQPNQKNKIISRNIRNKVKMRVRKTDKHCCSAKMSADQKRYPIAGRHR